MKKRCKQQQKALCWCQGQRLTKGGQGSVFHGLFLQDPWAEGRHTGQGEAMELDWKVQCPKRTLRSELRGKELGTSLEKATKGFKWKQWGNPGEQVLVQGPSQKASGVIFYYCKWLATNKTHWTLGLEYCSETSTISGCQRAEASPLQNFPASPPFCLDPHHCYSNRLSSKRWKNSSLFLYGRCRGVGD